MDYSLLPAWGPYSKKYAGTSRILDDGKYPGLRFDFILHPMRANSGQPVPNVTFPSFWHVMDAASDLSYFRYRFEIEWKDQVYCDVTYLHPGQEKGILAQLSFVNNTDLIQNCLCNAYASLEYPQSFYILPDLPRESDLVPAQDYVSCTFALPRPWDHLTPDGMRRGVFSDPLFTGGYGFGDRVTHEIIERFSFPPFGGTAGDKVQYQMRLSRSYENPCLLIRCRTAGPSRFHLTISGDHGASETDIVLPASEDLTLFSFPVCLPKGRDLLLTLTAAEQSKGVELDFLAIAEEGSIKPGDAGVSRILPSFRPECAASPAGKETGPLVTLRYADCGETFRILPLYKNVRFREISSGCLEDALLPRLSQRDPSFDHVLETFSRSFSDKHSDPGFYENLMLCGIDVPPHSSCDLYVLVGEEQEFLDRYRHAEDQHADLRSLFLQAQEKEKKMEGPAGDALLPGAFGAHMMKASLLNNIVYPVQRGGQFIPHFTPGKRWDSLYTWDSGFIGLGLLEVNPQLSLYVLKTYLSSEDNPDWAFLHHGSPVPMQIFQYQALLLRLQTDRKQLYGLYPLLRRYFRYLAGRSEGSTTDPYKSRLTTTYDYFYSSCGMDDLPAQSAMYKKHLDGLCAPAISSSMVILFARILLQTAKHMQEEACSGTLLQDMEEYRKEIALRTDALQNYSWDPGCGYFSYVVHDRQGNPIGALRTDAGENLDKGMDGVYPLIAGACTKEQETILLSHIFSPEEMMTPVGISAVDQSASYFRTDGYWNGCVWFSHQWLLWKTMLDLGLADEAFRIAQTALLAYDRECRASYYTYEEIQISTGRGGWFHQFGGLSSPILLWQYAYTKPGTLSVGFDTWIEFSRYDDQKDRYEIEMEPEKGRGSILIAAVKDSAGKRAVSGGRNLTCVPRGTHALEIRIPEGGGKLRLEIS